MTEQLISMQSDDQRNNAKRLLFILLIANNIVFVIFAVLAWREPTWQLVVSVVASVVLTIVFVVSNRIIRRGSVNRGVQIAIYAVIFIVGLNGVWFAGLGLAYAIGLIMIVFQISSLTLDFRQSTWAMVSSVIAGLFLIAIDNLNLSFRLFFAPLTAVIPVIALLLALAFAAQIYRSFNQFGLRGKLVVTTVFVATVAVVIVAFGVQAVTQRTLTQEAGANIKTQADALGILVGELIFRQIDTMQSFALGRELNDGLVAQNEQYGGSRSAIVLRLIDQNEDWVNLGDDDELVQAILHNPMAEELAKFQQQFPEFQQVMITDQYGAIAAANGRPEQLFVGSEEWWRTAYANGDGRVFIQLAIDESSLVHGVRMAVPIYDTATRQVVGVLSSIAEFDALVDVLQAFQLRSSDKIELNFPGNIALDVTPEGGVEFENNEEGELELYATIEASEDGFIQTTFADQAVIGSVGHMQTLTHMPIIDALDWEVVVFRDQSDAFSSIETQQNLNVLMGAIVVVIAAAAAAFVGQRLAEPILRLKETAVRVQSGDLTARAVKLSDDEVGELSAAFNDMTDQLSATLQGLETRVAERTRVIEISAQVSRNLSTILDQKQLVQEVVTQVQAAFDYYYAQIYLWEEHKQQLVLAGGTGDVGLELLDQGHALELGSGLVGRAAETKLPVLITDVTRETSWLPNALLPDTKSEAAVPILIGEAVIGVLDIQHAQAEGLGEQDVELIQSVANQFAIAYQNARNYENQQKQAQYEGQINEIRSRIQQTRDVDSALKVAVRELADALGASKAKVQLHHNERNGKDTLQESQDVKQN